MTSLPVDFSGTEKPLQIQENLIAYMRLFAGLPGILTHDAQSFWIVSNKPAPGNSILRANWPNGIVEEQIDALLEELGRHVNQIDWMVFPNDQPSDLNQRLEARGMPGGPGGNWLWADLTSLRSEPAQPANFHIEQVRDDQKMAEWVRISEAGFGVELGIFYEAYARHGYGPGAFSRHYTGYIGDRPVTTATLLDAGGSAAIYDVSTPPALRGQGLGSAVTYAMMREINTRGYSETWIWSSNMAKRVYQKLGFIEADFGMREHTWVK